MKKLFSLLVLGLLVLSIAPFSLAEEVEVEVNDTELEEEMEVEINDTELEDEIETMSTPQGVEYRMNQLELSLRNHIEHAKDILTELEAPNETMKQLKEQVIELELVLERVQGMEFTGTSAEMAAEFVAVKKEAITISQQFRKAIKTGVSQEKISEIKSKTSEMKTMRKNEFKAQLEEKKEKMYMKGLSNLLKTLGVEDEDIMEQVENGELTYEEAVEVVKTRMGSLTKEEKAELKEIVSKNKSEAKANMEEKRVQARIKVEGKREEIKANKEAKMVQRKAEFSAKVEERKKEMDAKKAGLQESAAQRKVRTEERKNSKDKE